MTRDQSARAAEIGWKDFARRMQDNDVIIIPLGMTEQHGRHNPVSTDSIIANYCATQIAERSGALAAPGFPYGYGPEGQRFAGQLPISAAVLRKIWYSLAAHYAAHGARRILFVNGHGGNSVVLPLVLTDLRRDLNLLCTSNDWWKVVPELRPDLPCNDHGGKFETSCLLAICPELVNMAAAQPAAPATALSAQISAGIDFSFAGQPIFATLDDRNYTEIGNLGASPLEASAAIGREVLETYIEFNVALVNELRNVG
ncbi:MAG: creatininase family protein [Actinomycetia bacterium]|nr:creatininase family protein [Actinomycetes bacterium]